MSIVQIAAEEPAHKPVPVFGSAIDLAHGLVRVWVDSNQDLRSESDKALKFIFDLIGSPLIERNRFEKFIFNYRLKKHRETLTQMLVSLSYVELQIEALIGNASFLKAGIKNKIKNKKQFDDVIIEYKEITIMLLGLTQFLKYDISHPSMYVCEKNILSQVISESKLRGFYVNLYAKIGNFNFK